MYIVKIYVPIACWTDAWLEHVFDIVWFGFGMLSSRKAVRRAQRKSADGVAWVPLKDVLLQ